MNGQTRVKAPIFGKTLRQILKFAASSSRQAAVRLRLKPVCGRPQ
jgi:hypothetical protein